MDADGLADTGGVLYGAGHNLFRHENTSRLSSERLDTPHAILWTTGEVGAGGTVIPVPDAYHGAPDRRRERRKQRKEAEKAGRILQKKKNGAPRERDAPHLDMKERESSVHQLVQLLDVLGLAGGLVVGLLGVKVDGYLGLLDGLHGAGAGHTAAGAGHALQQIAGVLAGHRVLHHLIALP